MFYSNHIHLPDLYLQGFQREDLEAELRAAADAVGATLNFETLYRDYARYGVVTARAQ